MGIKRGRPQGPEKEQINIRLLPKYASLLKKDSPIFWWMRRNNIKFANTLKHGKTNSANPSNAVTTMFHNTIVEIIKDDPEAFLDYASRHLVHADWHVLAEQIRNRTA